MRKAQLVQSKKYGAYYTVSMVLSNGNIVARPLKRVMLAELVFTPDRLLLVGNNYKAKS